LGGWSLALAVGGILAGGAVGGIVGSFAGLPQTPPEVAEVDDEGPLDLDPFDHNVLPFLIPPFLILVIAAIIVTFGEGLLQLGKSQLQIGPIEIAAAVVAAVVGIFVIGLGAWWLSSRVDQSPPSSRDTVSHRAEH
jgi:NhaP-type Na+/H+ or K+/H+ antiporter